LKNPAGESNGLASALRIRFLEKFRVAGSRAEFAARTATPRLDGADARMIEVEGLTKRYGETVAIEGVTFSASPGDILGFSGRTARENPPRCAF
jgi:ATPase subunit of ABC transporter with duplicated ATPase domains